MDSFSYPGLISPLRKGKLAILEQIWELLGKLSASTWESSLMGFPVAAGSPIHNDPHLVSPPSQAGRSCSWGLVVHTVITALGRPRQGDHHEFQKMPEWKPHMLHLLRELLAQVLGSGPQVKVVPQTTIPSFVPHATFTLMENCHLHSPLGTRQPDELFLNCSLVCRWKDHAEWIQGRSVKSWGRQGGAGFGGP